MTGRLPRIAASCNGAVLSSHSRRTPARSAARPPRSCPVRQRGPAGRESARSRARGARGRSRAAAASHHDRPTSRSRAARRPRRAPRPRPRRPGSRRRPYARSAPPPGPVCGPDRSGARSRAPGITPRVSSRRTRSVNPCFAAEISRSSSIFCGESCRSPKRRRHGPHHRCQARTRAADRATARRAFAQARL